MFHFQNLYLFFITSLMFNLIPGNDMLYVASRSISQGTKAGIVSVFGIFLGCFVHIVSAVLGLSIIIAKSAYLFGIIKLGGAAYLIYLGFKLFVTKPNVSNPAESIIKADKIKLFRQGIITNALNPKVAIFFLSFLPQFIDPASPFLKIQLFTLGIWFNLQSTIILIIVAVVLGRVNGFFKQNPKIWLIQEKVTGAILIVLGIKLALAAKK
jgi:threonine/homoserine/homoserine lactone efflux protein